MAFNSGWKPRIWKRQIQRQRQGERQIDTCQCFLGIAAQKFKHIFVWFFKLWTKWAIKTWEKIYGMVLRWNANIRCIRDKVVARVMPYIIYILRSFSSLFHIIIIMTINKRRSKLLSETLDFLDLFVWMHDCWYHGGELMRMMDIFTEPVAFSYIFDLLHSANKRTICNANPRRKPWPQLFELGATTSLRGYVMIGFEFLVFVQQFWFL